MCFSGEETLEEAALDALRDGLDGSSGTYVG